MDFVYKANHTSMNKNDVQVFQERTPPRILSNILHINPPLICLKGIVQAKQIFNVLSWHNQ